MALRIPPRSGSSLLIASIAAMTLGAVTGSGACAKQPSSLESMGAGGAGGSTGSGGGATQDAGVANHGKEMFAALEADFYAACGPACHEAGGIADAPFLSAPDRYQAVTSWPGIVVQDPTTSKLATIPVAGPQHPYKKLDQAPLDATLYPKLRAWLAEEAKGIVTKTENDAGKFVDPFVPIMGFNAVYLTAYGADFTGMAITFTANQIDDTVLELTDLQVHPTATLGVHLVHPLFAVNPVGKPTDPDPVDSCSNVDQSFEPGESGTLGPGTMILTNWALGAKLSLAFEKIESISLVSDAGPEGGTTTGGCKDPDSFMANAQPALQANCVTCHGGGNAQAKGAIDMSAIDSDPTATCAQVKNRVNPADPASSQLFITTDPGGNAAHPYKFGGSASKFDAFQGAVSKWIQAEQ